MIFLGGGDGCCATLHCTTVHIQFSFFPPLREQFSLHLFPSFVFQLCFLFSVLNALQDSSLLFAMRQRAWRKNYISYRLLSVLKNVVCASSFLVSPSFHVCVRVLVYMRVCVCFVCCLCLCACFFACLCMCRCVCVYVCSPCSSLGIFFLFFALNKRQKTKNYTEKVK